MGVTGYRPEAMETIAKIDVGNCGLRQKCLGTPATSPGAGNELPPNTTNPPPKIVGQPPNPVGVEQPPGGTPPPKPVIGTPPGNVGVNKQPVGDGGTSPPKGGVTGVHPVYPVNPIPVNPPVNVNQPGTGTGEQIYVKSGAGQQNVQDLTKSWQQKVNDKNSVLYNGETSRGTGSVSPNVKSQIFNQSNQTSALGGSGKQKLHNEMLHVDKEKSNVQNFSSPAANHARGGHK